MGDAWNNLDLDGGEPQIVDVWLAALLRKRGNPQRGGK